MTPPKILHLWFIDLRPLEQPMLLNSAHAQKRENYGGFAPTRNNYQISTYTSVQVDAFGTAGI